MVVAEYLKIQFKIVTYYLIRHYFFHHSIINSISTFTGLFHWYLVLYFLQLLRSCKIKFLFLIIISKEQESIEPLA